MSVQMFYLKHLYNPDSELFAHLESVYHDEDESWQDESTLAEQERNTYEKQKNKLSDQKFGKLSNGFEMLDNGKLLFNSTDGSLNIGGINRGISSNIREVSADNVYSMRTVRWSVGRHRIANKYSRRITKWTMKKRLRLLQRLANAMFSKNSWGKQRDTKISAETLQSEKRALKEKVYKNVYTAADSL